MSVVVFICEPDNQDYRVDVSHEPVLEWPETIEEK
jgi:hypothetical protein